MASTNHKGMDAIKVQIGRGKSFFFFSFFKGSAATRRLCQTRCIFGPSLFVLGPYWRRFGTRNEALHFSADQKQHLKLLERIFPHASAPPMADWSNLRI
jgi:hypothetical protein